MQKKGSLFIQHLKLESNIRIDINGKFKKFLDNCPLILPTDHELFRCESTLSFIEQWNNFNDLELWQADFLYCVSRDYLIKRLAREKIMAFGIESILHNLSFQFGFSKEALHDFKLLRRAKAAYRNNLAQDKNLSIIIRNWFNAIKSLTNSKSSQRSPLTLDTVAHILPTRKFNSNYEKLRSLEAIYLLFLNIGGKYVDHELLTKFFTSPNHYGSSQACNSLIISSYLSEVCKLYKNQKREISEIS